MSLMSSSYELYRNTLYTTSLPLRAQLVAVRRETWMSGGACKAVFTYENGELYVPTQLYFFHSSDWQMHWDFKGTPAYVTDPSTVQTLYQGIPENITEAVTLLKFTDHYTSAMGSAADQKLQDALYKLTQLEWDVKDALLKAETDIFQHKNKYSEILKKCDLKFTPEEKEEVFKTWPVASLGLYEVMYNFYNQLYE